MTDTPTPAEQPTCTCGAPIDYTGFCRNGHPNAWAIRTNYVSDVRNRLQADLSDLDPALADLYTLLALVRGRATTLADVHDAWAVWRNCTKPGHPDLVPFSELTEPVQERDRPYMEAIRRAAPDRRTDTKFPTDPAERLRLAAAGRRRYTDNAPAERIDTLNEEARVLDWAARIVADDSTLAIAIPTWLNRDAGRAVPVDGAAMDARAADRAPCGNPNCACHGPTQTPDLPERTPEVTE